MSEAQWRGVLDVSLTGFFAALRPLILPMIGTRWGRIVAISSISALLGNAGRRTTPPPRRG
jgi:3-oxoacyl-[acyl-carrier protein] reductase